MVQPAAAIGSATTASFERSANKKKRAAAACRGSPAANHEVHRGQPETRGEQIESRRHPDNRLVVRGVQSEQRRCQEPCKRTRRQRAANEQDEQDVDDVEQDVREVKLTRVLAGERPVRRVGDETERAVVPKNSPWKKRITSAARCSPRSRWRIMKSSPKKAAAKRGPVEGRGRGDGQSRREQQRQPSVVDRRRFDHAAGFLHAT